MPYPLDDGSFFINLDFLRAALLSLIIPLLAALSMAFWSLGKSFFASAIFLEIMNFLYSFITDCISFFFFKLKICFLFEALNAFFADDVIGIARTIYQKPLFLAIKSLVCKYDRAD